MKWSVRMKYIIEYSSGLVWYSYCYAKNDCRCNM